MDKGMTCGWDTGTVGTGTVICGKPAKAQAIENLGDDKLVCGVHVRSARALGYDVTDLPGPDVRVGQVWADNDHRIALGESPERQVRVIEVDDTHATVMVCSKVDRSWGQERRSRIRLDRFRPSSTGYRLVTDVPREG